MLGKTDRGGFGSLAGLGRKGDFGPAGPTGQGRQTSRDTTIAEYKPTEL